MKACIKAWQNVINPTTGRVHDEEGLQALDAILYGPVREVKVVTDEVFVEMEAEFKNLHPDFCYDNLELLTTC